MISFEEQNIKLFSGLECGISISTYDEFCIESE